MVMDQTSVDIQKQSQELTRVNPDRNIFSINVKLTSTFYSTEVWFITITEFQSFCKEQVFQSNRFLFDPMWDFFPKKIEYIIEWNLGNHSV